MFKIVWSIAKAKFKLRYLKISDFFIFKRTKKFFKFIWYFIPECPFQIYNHLLSCWIAPCKFMEPDLYIYMLVLFETVAVHKHTALMPVFSILGTNTFIRLYP